MKLLFDVRSYFMTATLLKNTMYVHKECSRITSLYSVFIKFDLSLQKNVLSNKYIILYKHQLLIVFIFTGI